MRLEHGPIPAEPLELHQELGPAGLGALLTRGGDGAAGGAEDHPVVIGGYLPHRGEVAVLPAMLVEVARGLAMLGTCGEGLGILHRPPEGEQGVVGQSPKP